ncbi:MAG: dTDP-4-dehydrorhamnose 3,5-epimerase [Pseudomonadota bacterium]
MKFRPLPLAGAYLIELEPRRDDRGSFARTFCAREFQVAGLETVYVQTNLSENTREGTIRGMHFQRAPHAEVKLVRCVRGAVFDVIVDLRPGSASEGEWFGARLSQDDGTTMYVPAGFAHGYQALTDGAAVHYMASAYYEPGSEGGCRHDDPALAIEWPLAVSSLSPKDAAWPLLKRV